MYTIGSRNPLVIRDTIEYQPNKYQSLALKTAQYLEKYCHEMFCINPSQLSEIVVKVHPCQDLEIICELLNVYINFLVKTDKIEKPEMLMYYMDTGTSSQRVLHMLNSAIKDVTIHFIRNNQLMVLLEALSTDLKEFR